MKTLVLIALITTCCVLVGFGGGYQIGSLHTAVEYKVMIDEMAAANIAMKKAFDEMAAANRKNEKNVLDCLAVTRKYEAITRQNQQTIGTLIENSAAYRRMLTGGGR